MKIVKFLLLLALTLGVVATPVNALEDKQFFMLACDSEQYNGQLLNLSSDYATVTSVGTFDYSGDSSISCAGPAAYNMTDGYIYWISWASNPGYLIKTDPTTGAATVVAEFTREGGDPVGDWADGLAINALGMAYVSVKGTGIFSLDLTNGELREVILFDSDTYGRVVMYGFSYDPSTGKYIGVTERGTVFDINLASATMTEITDGHYFDLIAAFKTTEINYFYELDFDNEGNAYAVNGDLKIVSATDYSLRTISKSELNLFGVAAYSESFAIKLFKAESLKAMKRIKGISNDKLSVKAKSKIRTFSETLDATDIVCVAKIKRNPNLSSAANRASSMKRAKKACAIAKIAHPEANTTTFGWVTTNTPKNYVRIVLKNLR